MYKTLPMIALIVSVAVMATLLPSTSEAFMGPIWVPSSSGFGFARGYSGGCYSGCGGYSGGYGYGGYGGFGYASPYRGGGRMFGGVGYGSGPYFSAWFGF